MYDSFVGKKNMKMKSCPIWNQINSSNTRLSLSPKTKFKTEILFFLESSFIRITIEHPLIQSFQPTRDSDLFKIGSDQI